MPRRSKRSQAASQRMAQKNIPVNINYRSNSKPMTVIRGNFHQGNLQLFDAESVGRQCSCNVLVMLCTVENIFDTPTAYHLDEILQSGDRIYKTRCHELEIAKALHPSKILDQTQLPDAFAIGEYCYTIDYKHKDFRHGRLDDNHSQSELKTWLQYAFSVSNKNILILDGYMMAVYQHNATGQFIFFDSHSRNEIGLMTPEGTSVLLIFENFQNLLDYLLRLIPSLGAKFFGIQPIITHSNIKESDTTQRPNTNNSSPNLSSNKQSESNVNQDIPSCSTWNEHCFDPSVKSTSYKKWFNSLSDERKTERLQYMRTSKKRHYAEPQKRAIKQEYAKHKERHNYAVPEKRAKKLHKRRLDYADPEKRAKKQQSSKNKERLNYAIPEKRAKKQQSSKNKERLDYAIPEKRAKMLHKRRLDYAEPEKRAKKQQSSKNKERLDYAIPEKRAKKLHKRRLEYAKPEKRAKKQQSSKNKERLNYAIPEKRVKKQQSSKNKERLNYAIPEKRAKKQQSSKIRSGQYYADSVKRAAKIRDVTTKRSTQRQNIRTVIEKFKERCQKDKPIYKCEVCNRIQFRSQVVKFDPAKYDNNLLRKVIGSDVYRKIGKSNVYMCKTCKSNIRNGKIPRLSSFNKLGISKQPDTLSQLNMLERHLVSPALPFMKMINLIKGSQKGIHGQVVCVKADVENTVNCLPRLPTDESLIRVKLKRRLQYKGHQMCQDINPSKVRNALTWLKANNPLFEDIEIDFEEFNEMDHDQLVHTDQPPDDESSSEEESEQETSTDEAQDEDDVTNTSAPLYSFLHPVDFTQYIADKHDDTILSLAPGEDNSPERALEMEGRCFPVEFPDASNTYMEKRDPKVSPLAYFKARLFSADNRFARNPEYIFFAQYVTEVHKINSGISIAMRIGNTSTSDGREITASMLTDHDEVRKLIKRDQGYKFLKQVRGTPAFWEKSKKDLFAMIRQLGIPTFFVTFSAADRRWSEITNAILDHLGRPQMTQEQHENMTWEEHCRIIMENPVIATIMFYNRVKSFIKDVIRSPANPIGEIVDYYYRTEFQQRGWPHIHMVAWVKDAPILDEDSDDEVIEFVDKYISCEMPPEADVELHEIVSSVQTHSQAHTKSCRKTGKTCRFNFPRPPSNRTFICRGTKLSEAYVQDKNGGDNENDDDNEQPNNSNNNTDEAERFEQEYAKEALKQVWNLLSDKERQFDSFEDVLKAANMSQDELEKNLATCTNRQTIYYKRRIQEQWINNYNPHLIRAWNGNMDIQYVMDPYSCVMYIVSYISKSEREMGDLLRNAQREAYEGNDEAVSQLRRLGSLYLHHREISVMGSIYFICGLPLQKSTRKVIFLQTDKESHKISKPLHILQNSADDCDNPWQNTQIDKYIARPNNAEFNNMCMAKFFSLYHYMTTDSDNGSDIDDDSEDTDDDEDNDASTACHILQNGKGRVKKRKKKAAIIRYYRVSIKKDRERYFMNMLRLYLPHRTESLLPNSYRTFESYYLHGHITINKDKVPVKDIVTENMKDFEPETENLDRAWEALEEAADLQDAWAAIIPQAEQERLDAKMSNANESSDDDLAEIDIPEFSPLKTKGPSLLKFDTEPLQKELTAAEALAMQRQLNDEQRQIYNFVSKWCDEKAADSTVQPFRIFLTGGAGTGKSHVIKCIRHHAEKAFAKLRETSDDTTVLVVAHTGTAAFNISGETICSAFRISINAPRDYQPLREESLNTLRVRFHHLQLVIIDEISMVSAKQLSYIHGRLQQIKGTSNMSYFGNVSILAVGDFYQLPPVRAGLPICYPHKEILKDLWNPHFQKWELTQIMRQRDDKMLAELLNRLRTRERDQPLLASDESVLQSRVVGKDKELSAPSDALHIYAKNEDVNRHNDEKLEALDAETLVITAIDTIQDGGTCKQLETPYQTTRNDSPLVSQLKLAIGARAMLITNVDVSDGLSNGVSGVIKGIEYGKSHNMPKTIFVHFDSPRIGSKLRSTKSIPSKYSDCIPINPHKNTMTVKLNGKAVTITREQVPLKLSWAVTVHKVQGQTTSQAVISMKHHTKAMAYVALSRVSSIDGMYLIDYDSSKIFCDEGIAKELAKMPVCDVSLANPFTNVDHNKSFIIAHHNIQSLNAHIDDLKLNKELRKAHVICISETWFTGTEYDQTIPFHIDGYDLVIQESSGRGRGVAMYIQRSVNHDVFDMHLDTCDILVVKITGKANLAIVTVYKPEGNNAQFRREMNDLCTQLDGLQTDHTVILGDFNHDLNKQSPFSCFKDYCQVITKPTTHVGTLIDHIYIKPLPSDYIADVFWTYYSYHHPVAIGIKYCK